MADNVAITPGTGTSIATDEIAGAHYQRVKTTWGPDGTANDVDTASGKALPIQVRDSSGNAIAPLSESDFDTKIGSLTETAPATDTASSGLNGRLQRIAQRITSFIALIPSALTGSGNFKVAVQEAIPAGTNNIGDVDVLTVPADPFGANADAAATAGSTGSIQAKLRLMTSQLDSIKTAVETLDNVVSGNEAQVDVLTQPARAATTDTITAKLATDTIQNGTTALTPKFVAIDAASSGDNTILAAVNPKKIRVLSCFLIAAAAVTVRFESGAGGTALTGQMNLAANGGFVLPFNPVGWFETASNTLLNLELSGAVSVDGSLTYVEV